MAAPKGSKKFYNPETGKVTICLEHPGEPWIPGIPESHKNAKGKFIWHNPETGEHITRAENPGEPWVKGLSSDRRKVISVSKMGSKQTEETKRKRAESLKKRHREEGFSEKELRRVEVVAEKLRGQVIPQEQRDKISNTLRGRKSGYNPKRSRTVAERCSCDIVYILKVTTPQGLTFGKWGSTKSAHARWKPFKGKGFKLDVIVFYYAGSEAPRLEEWVGSILSSYPANLAELSFGGYTETFEWSEKTVNLLSEIKNELEKNSSPQRNW